MSRLRPAIALTLIVIAGLLLGTVVHPRPPTVRLAGPSPAELNVPAEATATGTTLPGGPSHTPVASTPGTGGGQNDTSPEPTAPPETKHWGPGGSPQLSGDGRSLAFMSFRSPEVAAEGRYVDVFVYDRQTHALERESDSESGEPLYVDTYALSGSGRYLAFYAASYKVYVKDRIAGTLTLASVSSTGQEGNDGVVTPWVSISDDGRFVAFNARSTNLVPGDTNGVDDIFVHDVETGETTRASIASSGEQANGESVAPTISGNGRFVAFMSAATNLVTPPSCAADQPSGCTQVYMHDRTTGETTLISKTSSGLPADGVEARYPSISDDGRFVAFDSPASNLSGTPDTDGSWSDVFVADRQTGKVADASGELPEGVYYDYPNMTGDGTIVAFENQQGQLFMNDVTAGTVRTIENFVDRPGFSSDGRLVAYVKWHTDGIIVLDLRTGEKELIT